MNHNIEFRELVQDDIELVRTWRNNKEINRNFIDRSFITTEKQQVWFNKIDLQIERYYIVYYKKEKLGLFYLTNIDKKNRVAEPNGFIGDTKYLDSFVAGEILISFLKFVFLEFDLELLTGKIVVSNTNFIKQHEMMDAELELDETNKVVRTKLTRKRFDEFIEKMKL